MPGLAKGSGGRAGANSFISPEGRQAVQGRTARHFRRTASAGFVLDLQLLLSSLGRLLSLPLCHVCLGVLCSMGGGNTDASLKDTGKK